MIFYFTATGNSLYVAKQLDDTRISIAQAIHDKKKLYKAEQIGIVCPVFWHEVPSLVKEFLAQSIFKTDYFYLVLTYGNRHGGAAELSKKMLDDAGIQPSYINLVLMADNFLPVFDMDEQRTLDKKVESQIARIRNDIQNRKFFIPSVTEADRAAHREHLARMATLPEDFFKTFYQITDECIGCEICTKVCPKKCFTVHEQKSKWDPRGCITCMACVHACPMMAIRMNIPEENPQARYRNENISICEIIQANNQRKNGGITK